MMLIIFILFLVIGCQNGDPTSTPECTVDADCLEGLICLDSQCQENIKLVLNHHNYLEQNGAA